MTAIFSLSKWFEIIERGTSGDQVSDILFSWEKDRIALTNRIAELEEKTKGTYCAYCGAVFTIDDNAAALVSEHIRTCEKHPMRDLEHVISKLTNDNQRMKQALIDIDHGPVGYWNEPQHAKEVISQFMKIAGDALK